MGFSVSDDITDLEYAGNNLNTLFAQRRNLLSLNLLAWLDILRFNKVAVEDLEAGGSRSGETLQDYLERTYEFFRRNYLISMASAIWSANFEESLNFPAEILFDFSRITVCYRSKIDLSGGCYAAAAGGAGACVRRFEKTFAPTAQ